MLIYYVYAYLRKTDNTPYYIGKGKRNRAFKGSHSVSIPKDLNKIVFLETNLTNIGACALERRYIKWYGRKGIDENGILRNITAGGDGNTGPRSEEWRKNHSLKLTGKKSPRKGIKINDTTNFKKTKEHKDKISNSKKGKYIGKNFWNNGFIQTVSYESPGPDWIRGMLPLADQLKEKRKIQSRGDRPKKYNRIHKTPLYFWNNGVINTRCEFSTGVNWTRGRLTK